MKSQKNVTFFIIIALIFSILYLILAAKPLRKEYQFQPEWKINTTKHPVPQKNSEDLLYFRLGNSLGYFTKDGEISLYKTFPDQTSISNSYFATYDYSSSQIKFFNNQGIQCGEINQNGFPYFADDIIYVMLASGSSFIKCNEYGKPDWNYEGIIPITAFSSAPEYTAAGFADGTIKIFNNKTGNIDISFAPGGSDNPVILGIDISNSGNYIAAIAGHNKQRFIVAHREGNQPKIIYHTFLNEETTYQTLVHFCNDDTRIIYIYENSIGIYDYKSNKNTIIPINSRIISIRESNNLVFLLGKNGNKYTVYIVEKTNTLEGSFTFEAKTAFIQADENVLYVGKDDSISKISLNRE